MTHFERAVDIRRNTGTLHGAGGAHLLANVGALKVEKADYQGAMKVFMEALVIRETAGELHTHEGATLLKMLAEAEHAAGKKTVSAEHFERASQIRENLKLVGTRA